MGCGHPGSPLGQHDCELVGFLLSSVQTTQSAGGPRVLQIEFTLPRVTVDDDLTPALAEALGILSITHEYLSPESLAEQLRRKPIGLRVNVWGRDAEVLEVWTSRSHQNFMPQSNPGVDVLLRVQQDDWLNEEGVKRIARAAERFPRGLTAAQAMKGMTEGFIGLGSQMSGVSAAMASAASAWASGTVRFNPPYLP